MSESSGRADADSRRLIDWTGERCVPWADDAQVIYEHYHRYAVAARFVRGRRVLDLASGEGFGAALLAEHAAEVVGVDIAPEAVEHAERTHGGRNVSFVTGSITDPDTLADQRPFDAVVCFEAIEHVDDHAAVLALARSRLAPGGLFLASTPDTAIYHDEHGNENPFHVRELTARQFEELLEGSFRHVAMLKQNVAVGSLLTPSDPGDLDTAVDGVRLQTLHRNDDGSWSVRQGVPHTYALGVASDGRLPNLPAVAVLLDDEQRLARQGGANVAEIVEQRDAAVADVARLNEQCRRHTRESEEFRATITRLEAQRGDAERRADEAVREQNRLRGEVDRIGAELHDARMTGERDAARVEWLRDTVASLEARVADAERRSAELETRNAELAEQNSALVQRAVRKYRGVLERVAPRGTGRRDVYELALGRDPRPVTTAEHVDTGPLPVPRSERPRVSVVVPVHGEWAHTRQCLRFLGGHRVSVPFEVIVVDDASPDDSAEKLAACEGVRLVRTERNLGFVGACNLGAEHARGEHLFFLNNDAEVTESWLDTLMDTMDSDERIGLVGAKLVYPDGRLQECGSIVWSDGSGWNVGRFGAPDAAEHSVLRDVDYCSGAALLVRTGLFRELGGFDTRYAPAYYEDTDLAFAVRAAGYRTVVQPQAVVVHHEGASNGTDVSGGVKKHQELNRQVFAEKWARTLAAEHLPEATTRNLWMARHRGTHGHFGPIVLVKDHQVPRPDFDSGSVRMRRVLEQLVGLGARVVFMPANHARLEPYTTDLQRIGVTVLPEPQLQQAFLTEVGSRITLALLSRPQVAWSLVEELRTTAPDCVIAYDTVDVHFLRLERQAELAEAEGDVDGGRALRRKAFASRQMEIGLVRSCDVTLVVSDAEQRLLSGIAPDADVRVLSNVHDTGGPSARPAGRANVLFVGGFDHPPNIDAVTWAAREVMPLVRERCPEAVLHVVGSNPTDEVLRLDGDGVEVHGWVADLEPVYAAARVTVAPLRFGAGVKGKVGESLGAGVPVVGTTVAVEGMRLTDGQDVLIADDARGLAAGIVRLLTDDEAWSEISEAGRSAVAAQFGPDVSRATLSAMLTSSAPSA